MREGDVGMAIAVTFREPRSSSKRISRNAAYQSTKGLYDLVFMLTTQNVEPVSGFVNNFPF